MKWKRIFIEDGHKKRFSHHEAKHDLSGFTFEVESLGGFITVKSFWLTVYARHRTQVLARRFFKFADAKIWVGAFLSEGATIRWTDVKPLYS